MSKRAEQERKAKAYYDNNSICCSTSIVVETFLAGYEQAEKDFMALVKQYIEKGERCMEQEGESQTYAFWDGFHNCAENILRELEEKDE